MRWALGLAAVVVALVLVVVLVGALLPRRHVAAVAARIPAPPAAVWSALTDPAAYPTAVRVGAAAGAELGAAFDPGHAYAFGLERVLDGLGVLIERRGSEVRQ